MFNENYEDVSEVYDSHLLSGDFAELDELPADTISRTIADADLVYNDSKTKKGAEKTSAQADALIKYSAALALSDKCSITDTEGLFSFICVRHPELELDWSSLRRIVSMMQNSNIDYQEQKKTELTLTLYISAVKGALKKE